MKQYQRTVTKIAFVLATGAFSVAEAGPLDAISVIRDDITIKSKARDISAVSGASGKATGAGQVNVGNPAGLTNVHGVTQMGSAYIGGKITIDGKVRDVTNVGSNVNVGGVVQGAQRP